MHGRDHDQSLADTGGNALYRARADVADREQAGNGGRKEGETERRWPAGYDEGLVVKRQAISQPVDTIMAQVAAGRDWLQPHGERYADLKTIGMPVLVVNGSDDVMLTTVNSYHLQQNLPDAQLIIYPDSGHAPHFQYPALFLAHARLFLDGV